MKLLRALLLSLAVIVGLGLSVQTVKADDSLGGFNAGEYVYEDDEVITNSQYSELEKINDETNRGANPQKLYLVLINSKSSWKTFSYGFDNQNAAEVSDGGNSIQNLIIGKTGMAVIGHDRYTDLQMDEGEDLDDTNNYIVFNFQTNRFYFDPSDQAQFYITDLMVWNLKRGLGAKLNSDDPDQQMEAIMQFSKRLQPKMENVAETDKLLNSPTYGDVSNKVKWGLSIIGIIIGLFIIIVWHRHHPHQGGGGSELGNSDYDAGFDEGYYYGSNDPFM